MSIGAKNGAPHHRGSSLTALWTSPTAGFLPNRSLNLPRLPNTLRSRSPTPPVPPPDSDRPPPPFPPSGPASLTSVVEFHFTTIMGL